MDLSNIIYLIIGAIIGFLGTIIIEYIKRLWAENDQKERNKKILKGLEKEIEEGIERCEGIIKMADKRKGSLSRIYIGLWESIRSELAHNISDIEILILLHKIYYRFDLVNFNMERNLLLVGAAFAKGYINEIKENLDKFKDKIIKF